MKMHRLLAVMVLSLLVQTAAGCRGGDPQPAPTTALPVAAEEGAPADEEVAQIYAAAIVQIYVEDGRQNLQSSTPTVYVLSEVADWGVDSGTELLEVKTLPPELQAAISAELAGIDEPLVWVDSRQEVSLDPETNMLEGGSALISVGNIHLQADGSVQVPADITLGDLVGAGTVYVVEKGDGQWRVTGNTGFKYVS